MSVTDVTAHFAACYENVVKAERRGGDVLILFGGDGEGYELTYRWLVSEHAELSRVLGSEVTRWGEDEVDLALPLFEQFRLFP